MHLFALADNVLFLHLGHELPLSDRGPRTTHVFGPHLLGHSNPNRTSWPPFLPASPRMLNLLAKSTSDALLTDWVCSYVLADNLHVPGNSSAQVVQLLCSARSICSASLWRVFSLATAQVVPIAMIIFTPVAIGIAFTAGLDVDAQLVLVRAAGHGRIELPKSSQGRCGLSDAVCAAYLAGTCS